MGRCGTYDGMGWYEGTSRSRLTGADGARLADLEAGLSYDDVK